MSVRGRALPAWLLTAAFGVAYVIVAPVSSDLAAAGYRSELLSRVGFTLWDDSWYGGHHLLAYSLLAPALGALLGVQLLAACSAVAATALFGALASVRRSARAARAATLWFALGVSAMLLANRVPFELGVAVALGALLAAQRAEAPGRARSARRGLIALALALAVLSAAASPVAGAFLALAALAWALAGRARALAIALAAAALVPVALLELVFPEGGTQPFVASACFPGVAAMLALAALLPSRERALRAGALLYAAAMLAAYAIPSAVGGNADRLGSLFAGPLLALALLDGSGRRRAMRGWRRWASLALAAALLYWQLVAPISNYVSAASDPAAKRSYYAPLLGELQRLRIGYGARPARIEVVPSRDHAEARWVAARVPLARGWERQLDTLRNGLFYEGTEKFDAARYERWLDVNAISYVALPDAPLDYSARAEARVVRASPRYLREVWRSAHWRLFAVLGARPLAQAPGTLTALGSDWFLLRAPRAGDYVVRVRFTPYWALARGAGCVARAKGAGEWTEVRARAPGTLRVAIDFSPARVLSHGPRCS